MPDVISAFAAPMTSCWPDSADSVLHGDLTAAAAYLTPAGGTVLNGVAPCGLADRDAGTVGFTTSLGLAKKLDRILRNPHVALAFHAREHGFSIVNSYVLVQGDARVDLAPSSERLAAFMPSAERFMGPIKRGPEWDWLLHEYYFERVFVDIDVRRVLVWPDLLATGVPQVFGAPLPPPAPAQPAPSKGIGPRGDFHRAIRSATRLPYQLLGFRGADGYPVVLPVRLAGADSAGIHLAIPANALPPGGRRAGLLAHGYAPQLSGLATRTFTGWLDVADDGSCTYAPHTAKGFATPPNKTLVLIANGLMAKVGYRKARRAHLLEKLASL